MSKIILAFDFGMKRIGVAIGQTVTRTGRPLITIQAKMGNPEWTQIDALVKEWRPFAIVVGIPLNMDGSAQPMSERSSDFAKLLRERFNLPVYEVDERLTTKEAREQLFAAGGYKALRQGEIDQTAAQLILQNWFAENKPE